jgi:preprotein translocase subunit YajC
VSVLLPFALILVAFYLLILRPQRARARMAQQMRARLAPGVDVLTTSGIHATVSSVEDDIVVLEVAPGVNVRFASAAIGRVLTDDSTDTEDADHADDDDDDETEVAGQTEDADGRGETALTEHEDAAGTPDQSGSTRTAGE